MSQRYRTINIEKSPDGKNYQTNTVYPEIPETEDDIYLITTDGDRYDLLAKSFYGDTRFWWIIASANNSTVDSFYIQPGTQLRIPADKTTVVNKFEEINRTR